MGNYCPNITLPVPDNKIVGQKRLHKEFHIDDDGENEIANNEPGKRKKFAEKVEVEEN